VDPKNIPSNSREKKWHVGGLTICMLLISCTQLLDVVANCTDMDLLYTMLAWSRTRHLNIDPF